MFKGEGYTHGVLGTEPARQPAHNERPALLCILGTSHVPLLGRAAWPVLGGKSVSLPVCDPHKQMSPVLFLMELL